MTTKKKRITLYMSEDIHQELVRLADEDSRSLSSFIEMMAKEEIKRRQKKEE